MKDAHPRITLLGNNSGRNLGDAAILSSILESLTKEMPDAEFFVPTIAPSWVDKNYGEKYKVKGINVMPWTGSIRLLGIPTLRCLAKSDVALICDGIIFGKKLFNPAFNYLITLIFLVPLARLLGCRVVCYSCGIGPFPNKISRLFARWVINLCDLVLMRENDSKELAEQIGVTKPIELTGDAAFVNPVSPPERAKEIAAAEDIDLQIPIVAINITSYLDSWLEPGEQTTDKAQLIETLAEGIGLARGALRNQFQTVVFCTQPMDKKISSQFAQLLNAKLITNCRYLSHDIQSVMRHCHLAIGMRFHFIILASAVAVPVVGLIYAPKVKGFFRLLGCEEYGLNMSTLTPQTFAEKIIAAWQTREKLQTKQQAIVAELQQGAHNAAKLLKKKYFS